MILIGSHALNTHHFRRIPQDLDLVGTYEEIIEYAMKDGAPNALYPIEKGKKLFIKKNNQLIEAEIAHEGNSAEQLMHLVQADSHTTMKEGMLVPSLDILYMLKMSHRYLKNNPFFLKTMQDIHFMRAHGAVIRPEHEAFFKLREKTTYDYSHPKLNVMKSEFFDNDSIDYQYEHDDIHVAIKHLDKPAYNYYKPDESEVFCSRNMFMNAPELIRLYGVLEESYVLALERSQIPFANQVTPKKSFDMALMKVCTSITSGWFREYAWENYEKIQALYDESYVHKFWQAVKNGEVSQYRTDSAHSMKMR